jgi:hypothetical protein
MASATFLGFWRQPSMVITEFTAEKATGSILFAALKEKRTGGKRYGAM